MTLPLQTHCALRGHDRPCTRGQPGDTRLIGSDEGFEYLRRPRPGPTAHGADGLGHQWLRGTLLSAVSSGLDQEGAIDNDADHEQHAATDTQVTETLGLAQQAWRDRCVVLGAIQRQLALCLE